MILALARLVCAVRGHRFALWERRSSTLGLLRRYFRCDRCGVEVYRRPGT